MVIDNGTAKTWDIIGRQVDRVYTITTVTLSNQLPSNETAAVTAIRPGTSYRDVCLEIELYNY